MPKAKGKGRRITLLTGAIFLSVLVASSWFCRVHLQFYWMFEPLGKNKKGLITITTRQENNNAIIMISDTGAGIPKNLQNRIFDPFFTTKEVGKGTGQGLSIAYNYIVKRHNGSLTFETEMDKGTTFIIKLPLNLKKQATELNCLSRKN